MYGWTEFLTDLGWFGAFVAAAVIALVERRFALFRRAGVARTPNFRFGVVGVVMTVICVVAISEPLTAAAYRLSLFSIADLPLPSFAKIVIGFVFIDLTLYANHIVSHKWSVLWRVHRTHHADPLVTGTTGLLHHPLETLWMFVFLLAVNVMFGVPVGAILIYAAVSALHSIFSHANLPMPEPLNRILGSVMVMPVMHRIHHSTENAECNSNYGLIFSFWDRLFGTYTAKPARGAEGMEMGVAGMTEGDIRFVSLLTNPFRRS
jgi:sterol desaturase/sphingolipid hydroxylase (fatty acid hydroxylase superfamily)